MNDKSSKTLTIKRKVIVATSSSTTSTPTIMRPIKRVITKEQLATLKASDSKPTQNSKPPKASPKKAKKPIRSPSDLRAKELDASLNAFMVWRERKPLALHFEKQIFQHVGKHHLSASKRVVMKLLEWHTANRFYLQAVGAGGIRFNLDGSEAETIQPHESTYALQKLAKRVK
jgi:hypothetical protein